MLQIAPLSSSSFSVFRPRSLPAPALVGSRPTCRDPRWPAIVAALAALRADGRRSIRIVDADCGAGVLLLRVVEEARALGFLAVEARGIGGVPTLIERAHRTAHAFRDPAAGITFELADAATALRSEEDFPADILLCGRHEGARQQAAAARLVITREALP